MAAGSRISSQPSPSRPAASRRVPASVAGFSLFASEATDRVGGGNGAPAITCITAASACGVSPDAGQQGEAFGPQHDSVRPILTRSRNPARTVRAPTPLPRQPARRSRSRHHRGPAATCAAVAAAHADRHSKDPRPMPCPPQPASRAVVPEQSPAADAECGRRLSRPMATCRPCQPDHCRRARASARSPPGRPRDAPAADAGSPPRRRRASTRRTGHRGLARPAQCHARGPPSRSNRVAMPRCTQPSDGGGGLVRGLRAQPVIDDECQQCAPARARPRISQQCECHAVSTARHRRGYARTRLERTKPRHGGGEFRFSDQGWVINAPGGQCSVTSRATSPLPRSGGGREGCCQPSHPLPTLPRFAGEGVTCILSAGSPRRSHRVCRDARWDTPCAALSECRRRPSAR